MTDKHALIPAMPPARRSRSLLYRAGLWLRRMGQLFNRRQHGFTLIEMTVVMIVIGVMAAITLPRFVHLRAAARQAINAGLQSGLNSGIAIAHAQSLVDGTALEPVSTVVMDGAIVNMVYGFPDASANGIVSAMSGLVGWTVDARNSPTILRAISGGSPTCQVTYAAARSVTQVPVITLENSDCS